MEGHRVQYHSKRIISILFLFFSIFLFGFVLTSQFYRDLENTFQSIMYNVTKMAFTVITEKVVVQILFDCMAYSLFHTPAQDNELKRLRQKSTG